MWSCSTSPVEEQWLSTEYTPGLSQQAITPKRRKFTRCGVSVFCSRKSFPSVTPIRTQRINPFEATYSVMCYCRADLATLTRLSRVLCVELRYSFLFSYYCFVLVPLVYSCPPFFRGGGMPSCSSFCGSSMQCAPPLFSGGGCVFMAHNSIFILWVISAVFPPPFL